MQLLSPNTSPFGHSFSVGGANAADPHLPKMALPKNHHLLHFIIYPTWNFLNKKNVPK